MTEGKKFDTDKLDYSLMPWRAVDEVVKVLMFGANTKGYGRNNWKMLKSPRRRYTSAAYRHLNEIAEGNWLDAESGLPHAAHAICCLLFLLWFGDIEDEGN